MSLEEKLRRLVWIPPTHAKYFYPEKVGHAWLKHLMPKMLPKDFRITYGRLPYDLLIKEFLSKYEKIPPLLEVIAECSPDLLQDIDISVKYFLDDDDESHTLPCPLDLGSIKVALTPDISVFDFSPNPEIAISGHGYSPGNCHPHISGGTTGASICMGDSYEIYYYCMLEGDIKNAVAIIKKILETDDRGSAYWSRDVRYKDRYTNIPPEITELEQEVFGKLLTTCSVCDNELRDDEVYWCESCDSPVCEEDIRHVEGTPLCIHCYDNVASCCRGCDENFFDDNMEECVVCGEYFCGNCRKMCAECGEYFCEKCMLEHLSEHPDQSHDSILSYICDVCLEKRKENTNDGQ